METVETIERKMKMQRILVRIFLLILLVALCFLVGWLITSSSYEGLDHEVLDVFQMHKPLLGHA